MAAGGRERIFLYGTLRRGGARDALRYYEGVEFVAPARVRGILHDCGDYPGLRLSDSAGWVTGEIFGITPTALARLDEWEGIDHSAPDSGEYRRVRVVADAADASQECWIYEIAERRCAGRPVIASGDWLAHAAARR